MSLEDMTRDTEFCNVCHTAFIPKEGGICKCPEEPVVNEWEDAMKQQEWHDSLVAGD